MQLLAARERAAKLLAAVDYDDSISKLCRTGGRVNLHGRAEFVRRAPLITRAEAKEQMLHLEGWYFGQKGTITIDGIEIEAKDWQDQKIEASVRSVPNGSHVVTVTNEEGAVNRAVFSVSSEESEGRKLFERSHSLPINDPAFIEDHCDRLYGPMAVCGGKIYTMASTAKYKMVQGIWCYDIERDAWSRLSLPEGFDTQSVPDSAFAGRQGKLYLYGTYHYVDEDGGEASENALWRYEPYGDFWERLEIPMPMGAEGICVLRDELFVVEGNVYGMKLDGAPPDEGEDYMSGFYKVDLANRALIRVATGQEGRFFSANAKVTAGKDRIYIYAPFEDDDPPVEEDTSENAPAEAGTQKKTVSEGRFLRASYDAARNRMTFEDLTDEFNRVLGQDLRTEYEYNMGADTPGEHFAIAGLDDGVAIIGSSSPGEDVHIIYDTEKEAAACDRATSYHMAFDPIAAYADGTLYVIGYNTTEPDVMYFRSQEMTPRAPQNGIAAGEGAGKGPVNPKILGGVTIGLFALVLLVLAQMKKNTP